jgi:hypothetical protein
MAWWVRAHAICNPQVGSPALSLLWISPLRHSESECTECQAHLQLSQNEVKRFFFMIFDRCFHVLEHVSEVSKSQV